MKALRFAALALACACLSLFPAGSAVAAPADLDRSFGGDGMVPVKWPSGGRYASESVVRMAVGPDDEVITVASNYSCAWQWECPTELALTRFDAAGKRDPSYGAESRLSVKHGPERRPLDLAVGADGKAVVATYDSTFGGLRVIRFDRAGRPDPTFGAGGDVTQRLTGYSAPVSVAVQTDGKVVVATEGTMAEGGQYLRLARYRTDGSLDPDFGGSGEVSVALSTQTRPAGLLVDPDGGITVASPYCCVGGTRQFGGGFSLLRVLGDGTPDPGFVGTGRLLFPTPGADGMVMSVALAADGGPVVLFEEATESRSTLGHLVKLTRDGSIDSGFGNGGRLRVSQRVGDVGPTAIAVDGQGGIVGVGSDDSRLAAFRLRADGSADRTFNGGQRVTVPRGGSAAAVALRSEGGIIVLGTVGREAGLVALRGGTDASRCQGRPATIVGTRGRDELVGTPRRDVIAALAGADKVLGLSGQDVICGGRGQDSLYAGAGRDSVQHEPGELPEVR